MKLRQCAASISPSSECNDEKSLKRRISRGAIHGSLGYFCAQSSTALWVLIRPSYVPPRCSASLMRFVTSSGLILVGPKYSSAGASLSPAIALAVINVTIAQHEKRKTSLGNTCCLLVVHKNKTGGVQRFYNAIMLRAMAAAMLIRATPLTKFAGDASLYGQRPHQ